MTKSDNQQIKDLYEWWNGWVFSFEKNPETSNIDNDESSGMDEAIVCIDDEVLTNLQGFDSQEDLMEGFDNLAVSTALPLLSTGSSRVPQPADLYPFAPGPSNTHLEDSEQPLEDEDIIIPEVSQPPAIIEDEIQGQNSEGKGKGKGRGKGKEKAVNIDTGGVQDNLVIGAAGGRQKRRPKKYDI
jgi:hypothetical protein